MRRIVFILLLLGASFLAGCGKKGIPIDQGDPRKTTKTPTPTVTATPTPTGEVPERDEAGAFSEIFLGGADSVWFFSRLTGDGEELADSAVDRVLYKNGSYLTVYDVKAQGNDESFSEWVRLPDEEILKRAAAAPSVTYPVGAGMFRLEAYEEGGVLFESVSFLNGDATAFTGNVKRSAGGLFTVPVSEPYEGTVGDAVLSGFVHYGREYDMGVYERFYMVCATDIAYQLDGADAEGDRFTAFYRIIDKVQKARAGWRFVGTDTEPFLGTCEILYDPEADMYITTDRSLTDYVIDPKSFWAYKADPQLKCRQIVNIHEGGGGHYDFNPNGSISDDYYSDWLPLRSDWETPVIRAVGTPCILTIGEVTLTLPEGGGYRINGEDGSRVIERELNRILADSEEIREEEICLYDSEGRTEGGNIRIELAVKPLGGRTETSARLSYTVTYRYRYDYEEYELIETGVR